MSTRIRYIALLIPLAALSMSDVQGQNADTIAQITIEYFTGIGCPNCARIDDFIDQIDKKYKGIHIEQYEVFKNKEQHKIMKKKYEQFKIGWNKQWVPVVFLPEIVLSGYSEIENKLESHITDLLKEID